MHDIFSAGFSPGLQLRALGLHTAFQIVAELVAFVQTRTLVPISAFVRLHAENPDDVSDAGSDAGSSRAGRGDSQDDDLSDDGEGDMTALFDVRLGINCWEEYDLWPLCQDAQKKSRGAVPTAPATQNSSASPAAGADASKAAGAGTIAAMHETSASMNMWTGKAVLNILESWTADPGRISLVHQWMSKILNAPAERMVRKSAARFLKGALRRRKAPQTTKAYAPVHHGIELQKMKARVAAEFVARVVPRLAKVRTLASAFRFLYAIANIVRSSVPAVMLNASFACTGLGEY